MRILKSLATAFGLGAIACDRQGSIAVTPTRLPARVVEYRFIATPVTTSGDTLGLFLDSGGGLNMLWPNTAKRLNLPAETTQMAGDDGGPVETWGIVPFPTFIPSATIPSASQKMFGERLGVPPRKSSHDPAATDGFLGRHWFADRIWELDYLAGTLSLWPNGTPAVTSGPHQTRLGFQQNVFRKRSTNFPRIRLAIDGDSIDMLFDTGATLTLTPSAVAALDDGGPPMRGGSFVAQSVFDGWRSRHPDWRVIERADSVGTRALSIIEVPAVSIGGYTVGPSWWAARPDRTFDAFTDWMDKPIRGSVGGSVFHYFRITLDYPHAVATFAR